MSIAKCLPLFALLLAVKLSAHTASQFTDEQLNQLLESKRTGVIYIWSPHMNYSDLGRSVIEKVCDDLGVPLTTLVDPFSRGEGVPNHSAALMELGAGLHFPSLHLYKDGELLPYNLMGAKSYPDYKQQIAKQLKMEVSGATLDFADSDHFLHNN